MWLLLWKLWTCVCTHHDDQQDVLEVIPEAQSVGAEKGDASLQELRTKQRDLSQSVLMSKQAQRHTLGPATGVK